MFYCILNNLSTKYNPIAISSSQTEIFYNMCRDGLIQFMLNSKYAELLSTALLIQSAVVFQCETIMRHCYILKANLFLFQLKNCSPNIIMRAEFYLFCLGESFMGHSSL